jgi:hypothetical protein
MLLLLPTAGDHTDLFSNSKQGPALVRLKFKLYFHPITGSSRTGCSSSGSRPADIHKVTIGIAIHLHYEVRNFEAGSS